MELKDKKLLISQGPLWHTGTTLQGLLGNHIIALLPVLIAAIVFYGFNAFRILALSVVSAVVFEIILRKLLENKGTVFDLHAVYSGCLLALLLPPSTPWWLVVVGTLVMVGIGKMIFGGLGSYPLNPVLVGFGIIQLSWPNLLNYTAAQQYFSTGFLATDPLNISKSSGVLGSQLFHLWDLFLGKQAGGIGASAGLFLLIGGLYLLIRGYITWHKPVSYLVGIIIGGGFFHLINPAAYPGAFFHLFAGITIFAAFFLITDTSSTPVNPIPMLIFGLCAGFFTILIRCLSGSIEGAVYAILIMNLLNPLLDNIYPKPAYLKGSING